MTGGGPADDLAAPDIEHHGEVEETGCRGNEREILSAKSGVPAGFAR
jgi:hypothetical protein